MTKRYTDTQNTRDAHQRRSQAEYGGASVLRQVRALIAREKITKRAIFSPDDAELFVQEYREGIR